LVDRDPTGDRRPPADLWLLLVAGCLAVVSLGLPWGVYVDEILGETPFIITTGTGGVEVTTLFTLDLGVDVPVVVSGYQHPVRAVLLVAVLVMGWALRAGSRRGAVAAVVVAALALPLGAPGAAGQLVYAAAVALAVVWLGRGTTGGTGARPSGAGQGDLVRVTRVTSSG
jgi:hypothetical protein